MPLNLTEMINLFSEDPKIYHPSPRQYSTLYLLRREIALCLGIDLKSKKPDPNQKSKAQWAGAMVILAGVDLLGKFFAGEDETRFGRIGKRFKKFLESPYFQASEYDATILYHLRNSLLHSFGLYSKDFNRGIEYNFTLTAVYKPLITILNNNKHMVDLMSLYDKFDFSVEPYLKDLNNSEPLRTNFENMFNKYGSIYVGPLLYNFSP